MLRNVPISLANPNVPVDYADRWIEIGKSARVNPNFTPLELKAFYVVGLIVDICQSVEWLLKAADAWPDKYLPAFGVFASGVDLFGRCLTGNTTADLQGNLAIGFQYISSPTPEPPARSLPREKLDTTIVVRTNHAAYTIGSLVDLRHYTTHGQATVKERPLPGYDIELLDSFPKLIGDAMETYWQGLKDEEEFCTRLGNARIATYNNRFEPLRDTLDHFAQPENSIGSLFYGLDWQVYK